MLDWVQDNGTLLWWLAAASVVTFLGTLVVVPMLVVRIPVDYFAHEKRPPVRWADQHPIVRALILVIKNVFGAVFVLLGLALLALPGQGILTIVIGVMLLDFPGKYRFERWLVSRRTVLRGIDWLRRRAGRAPLRRPPAADAPKPRRRG